MCSCPSYSGHILITCFGYRSLRTEYLNLESHSAYWVSYNENLLSHYAFVSTEQRIKQRKSRAGGSNLTCKWNWYSLTYTVSGQTTMPTISSLIVRCAQDWYVYIVLVSPWIEGACYKKEQQYKLGKIYNRWSPKSSVGPLVFNSCQFPSLGGI